MNKFMVFCLSLLLVACLYIGSRFYFNLTPNVAQTGQDILLSSDIIIKTTSRDEQVGLPLSPVITNEITSEDEPIEP